MAKKTKNGTVNVINSFFPEWLAVIVSVWLIFITVLGYILTVKVAIVRVSGTSMMPTLKNGDYLSVVLDKEPDYDDVIIVKTNGHLIIKRVIAKGGDTVELKDGKVFLNGEFLADDFERYGTTTVGVYDKYVLNEDEVFYLGDNRKNSRDSRINGPCSVQDVYGIVTDWSLNHPSALKVIGLLTEEENAFD